MRMRSPLKWLPLIDYNIEIVEKIVLFSINSISVSIIQLNSIVWQLLTMRTNRASIEAFSSSKCLWVQESHWSCESSFAFAYRFSPFVVSHEKWSQRKLRNKEVFTPFVYVYCRTKFNGFVLRWVPRRK